MENELTWMDRNITPRTGAYKNFVKEMESMSPEHFFRDGERKFTDREKKFMAIYQSKGKEFIQGSNFTLKTFFNSNQDFPIEDKFNNPSELVRFIEKQQLNNKVLILHNAMKFTETIIDSEATKHKVLSDFWAQELETKTDLSSGLTSTQIDERQAFHYRNYEREAKMLGIDVTPFEEIGIKALADKLQNHYEINEEPTWNFSNPDGLEVLKAAIEVSNMREEVKNAIFNYLQTFPPMLPERQDYYDGSYDQGESDYERALENYKTKKEPEYIDKIASLEKVLAENNIAIDKLPVLEELEAHEFKYLVYELEKYFLKEIQNIIPEKRGVSTTERNLVNTEKSKAYIESPREEFHLNISEIKNKPRDQQKLMIPDFLNGSFLSDNQMENLISGKEVTFLDKYDDLDQMLQLKDDGRISYFYPSGETGYLLNKDVEFSNARIDGLAKEALQNPLYLQNFDYTTQDIVNKYIYENTRYFPIFEKDIAIAYEPKIRQDIDISTQYVNDAKTNLEKKNGDLSINQIKNLANSLAANITFFKNNINNQNPNIMETQKEFDQVQYLKDQLKYLGFGEGEKLHKDLEKGIKSVKQQFEIQTTSDKALLENKVDFILKFNKTESGGVFLNSYNAKLTNEKGEEISHNFPVNRENTFTAKEAVNLLEGRAVKIEFQNPKTEQMEPAFVKFNFSEPKTEKGNYNFQNFYKNYGVDTGNIVEKSNLIFDKPEYKENTIKSLEKGNIVKVKFELEDKVIEGKAVLNPQYKNLNLYDSDMNRINTNKPLEGLEQDNKHEKNNVKEQSIKR
ncbi:MULTISPECIES: hypothetical protein [unclassified Chryseobacterium]|uniref:hypothetical protein n=1 Tax=unclassified Chryseobacterium TaxID=2593645 RepID=UPI001E3C6DB2|nr:MULTISPECIES: hypothetical protein [unclassified Chryseobacterium]